MNRETYYHVGHTDDGNVHVKVTWVDGVLSLVGTEGRNHGGQIDMGLQPEEITPAEGWTREMITTLWAIWKRWHLNDMKAGTPAQQAHLDTLTFPGYPTSYYVWAVEELAKVGLRRDNGYEYGSKWLREEVPEEVILQLEAFPTVDKPPSYF